MGVNVCPVTGGMLVFSEPEFRVPARTFPCQTWNCHTIPCGISELSLLSSWLVCLSPAFPRSLCSPSHLHLLRVPLPILLLQPLFSPPTSDPVTHIQEVSSIFSCISRSSQNIDKTQTVRSTAPSNGAGSRTPPEHGG